MKREIPVGLAVGIILAMMLLIGGLGYWFYTRPDPLPPPPPRTVAQPEVPDTGTPTEQPHWDAPTQ